MEACDLLSTLLVIGFDMDDIVIIINIVSVIVINLFSPGGFGV